MTSLAILLAADALAKLGATVGGGLAVIGAGNWWSGNGCNGSPARNAVKVTVFNDCCCCSC